MFSLFLLLIFCRLLSLALARSCSLPLALVLSYRRLLSVAFVFFALVIICLDLLSFAAALARSCLFRFAVCFCLLSLALACSCSFSLAFICFDILSFALAFSRLLKLDLIYYSICRFHVAFDSPYESKQCLLSCVLAISLLVWCLIAFVCSHVC